MKLVAVLGAALVIASACSKKKQEAKPAAGSGSQVAAAPGDAAVTVDAAPPVDAKLEFIELGDDDVSLATFLVAFDKKMPRLPAVTADGSTLAYFNEATSMSMPPGGFIQFLKLPTNQASEQIWVMTEDESSAAEGQENWRTPAIEKKLKERGKTIVGKLAGFHSLHDIALAKDDKDQVAPMKIGDSTLTATMSDDESLLLVLTGPNGQTVHRERIEVYSAGNQGEGMENAPCNYRPLLQAAYGDPARPNMVYIEVRFRWQELCDEPRPKFVVWSTDPSSTSPAELVADAVARQFDMIKDDNLGKQLLTADAAIVMNGQLTTAEKMSMPALPGTFDGHDDSATAINVSADGKSAWASELSTLRIGDLKHGDNPQSWRASDVLVQTPKGWRIAALAWTSPTENATANRDAKAGKLTTAKLAGDPGDASLNAVFAKLTTEGVTNVAKDLVAIGSGPGERTAGAPAFTKAWNAAWKGKTTVVSSVARLAPSGTTGWVAATIELQKTGYKIPFTVFAVFDKDAAGAWTLVHIHFAV
jgi:ketosteroid isomerase-like protein